VEHSLVDALHANIRVASEKILTGTNALAYFGRDGEKKFAEIAARSVPSSDSGPVFVKTGLGERLTVIAVDSGVRSVDGEVHDILFVGTTHGRVLKFANTISGSGKRSGSEPALIESLQVFPYHVPVRNLLVQIS
jgi:hypothetical protein